MSWLATLPTLAGAFLLGLILGLFQLRLVLKLLRSLPFAFLIAIATESLMVLGKLGLRQSGPRQLGPGELGLGPNCTGPNYTPRKKTQ